MAQSNPADHTGADSSDRDRSPSGTPHRRSARDQGQTSGRRSAPGRNTSGRSNPREKGSAGKRNPDGTSSHRSGGERKPGDSQRTGLWTRDGKPARGDRRAQQAPVPLTPEQQRARELRPVRARHEDPDIPETLHPRELDKDARLELKTLTKENADRVAGHLIMAARLIDDDPHEAHRHALSASRRAGRVPVVRETLAITAYAIGDFALALRELRTYRRLSGSNDQLPLMVDSERGVGRPDRALELGRSVDRDTLPVSVQVALAIAMSGARLDLNQPDNALVELSIPQLDPDRAFSWSPALFNAYAEVLEELGRESEAAQWRTRAVIAEDALDTSDTSDYETVVVVEEAPTSALHDPLSVREGE